MSIKLFKILIFWPMILALGWLIIQGCSHKKDDISDEPGDFIFQPLPENLIAYSEDFSIRARYVDPTTLYNHGVLGDNIEAGGLLVVRNNVTYYHKLNEGFVFEDLRPRIYDVNNDGDMEYITIQSSLTLGARICIFKIIHEKLEPFITGNFIGTPYRWMNIAAVNDLDNDGMTEIAWVQTPHIGGILKIGTVVNDSLIIRDEWPGVSNHKIGARNLCLSVVVLSDKKKILFIPDTSFSLIIGFILQNHLILPVDTIEKTVNPLIPLFKQYSFPNLQEDNNCIFF